MKCDPQKDVPLSELARILPTPAPYATVWRWARIGVQSESGRIVKLQTVRLPGCLGSSLNRYDKFLNELNDSLGGQNEN